MIAVVLDDSELNNLLMTEAIRAIPGCVAHTFTEPEHALDFIRSRAGEIGVAITDYEMPGMNGVDFIRAARTVPGFHHVPVVMVTSSDDRALRRQALEAGATDFLRKPFDALEVRPRIANLLALNQARLEQQDRAAWLAREVASAIGTIEAREREIVTTLMKAAEHRDMDTGEHVSRVAAYVELIATELGYEPDVCSRIAFASTMHDVGKIAVPDAILLKNGPLTSEERIEVSNHAEKGHKILSGSSSDVLRLAAEIALSHHEHWDGSGYPRGLAGEEIPVSGRIVAVADVFDALVSDRPYKKAWPIADAKAYLIDKAGTQFDPACVDAFLRRWADVVRLIETHAGVAA